MQFFALGSGLLLLIGIEGLRLRGERKELPQSEEDDNEKKNFYQESEILFSNLYSCMIHLNALLALLLFKCHF